jgi:MFS family permease
MTPLIKRLKVLITVADLVPLLSRNSFRRHLHNRLFYGMVFAMYPMARIISRKALDAPQWHIALLVSAPMIGFLIVPFWNIEKKPVTIVFWSQLVVGVLLIAAGFCSSAIFFALAFVTAFIANALTHSPFASIMRSIYPQSVRGSLVSFINSRVFLVGMLFVLISGWLLDINPLFYRIILPVAGIASIASGFCVRKIKLNHNDPANSDDSSKGVSFLRSTYTILKDDLEFRKFMIGFFLFGLANLMLIPVLTLYLTDTLNVNYQSFAKIQGFAPWIMLIVCTPLWGRFVDRYNPMMCRGMFTFVWSLAPLMFFFSHNITLVYVGMLIEGLVKGGSNLTWLLGVMYFSPQQHVPRYMKVHLFLCGVRGLIGPFLGVALVPIVGTKALFLMIFLLMLFSSIYMLKLGLKKRKENLDYDDQHSTTSINN